MGLLAFLGFFAVSACVVFGALALLGQEYPPPTRPSWVNVVFAVGPFTFIAAQLWYIATDHTPPSPAERRTAELLFIDAPNLLTVIAGIGVTGALAFGAARAYASRSRFAQVALGLLVWLLGSQASKMT